MMIPIEARQIDFIGFVMSAEFQMEWLKREQK